MKRVLVILPVLVAAGCGGGGGDDAGGSARVVTVSATDALRFDPATVTAEAGEKVTFRITNAGKVRHEFVIGDDDYHAAHSASMSSSPSAHGGHDEGGSSADLQPGATTDLTFTMPDGAAPRFACYVDKHNLAGMTGTVAYG